MTVVEFATLERRKPNKRQKFRTETQRQNRIETQQRKNDAYARLSNAHKELLATFPLRFETDRIAPHKTLENTFRYFEKVGLARIQWSTVYRTYTDYWGKPQKRMIPVMHVISA